MNASTRIVVIGGGIVGASVAYHLARRGVSVIIVAADHAGAATDAGAGIICPWADQADDAGYRLAAEGARYYPELLAMLAGDGQADTGYAKVGALCVAAGGGALQGAAARLRSRLAATPEIGEVAVLEPGGPARMFPPLAGGLAGLWIAGGARVDGRAIRDSLLRAAAGRGARRIRSAAWLDLAAGRVTGVRAGTDRIGADAVVVAAGAWTAQVCAGVGWPLPIGRSAARSCTPGCPAPIPLAGRWSCPPATRTCSASRRAGSYWARPGRTSASSMRQLSAGWAACWPPASS
jgi:D-amino-acid dehydrogenase